MRFMVLIYNNHATVADMDGPGAERFDETHKTLIDELSRSGELVGTAPLDHVGRLVRRREDSLSVTDGPFTEGIEFIGGYYLIEVVDEARAVAIAGRFRETDTSLVEVRRVASTG